MAAPRNAPSHPGRRAETVWSLDEAPVSLIQREDVDFSCHLRHHIKAATVRVKDAVARPLPWEPGHIPLRPRQQPPPLPVCLVAEKPIQSQIRYIDKAPIRGNRNLMRVGSLLSRLVRAASLMPQQAGGRADPAVPQNREYRHASARIIRRQQPFLIRRQRQEAGIRPRQLPGSEKGAVRFCG